MSYSSSRPIATSLESWPVRLLLQSVRHDVEDDKVINLVASLQSGQKLPAIFVLVDNGTVTILDGHHRVAAWGVWAGADFQAPVIVHRAK